MEKVTDISSRDYTHEELHQAIYRLLEPLISLLIKQGIPYSAFAELARQSYVDVATKGFALPGRQQSVSRVSVLTGINRKDVRSLQQSNTKLLSSPKHLNRASRVVNGWLTDERYLDSNGVPKSLPMEGTPLSFTELVSKYGGDVPVRSLLDELLNNKSVTVDTSNWVELKSRCYVPNNNMQEKIRISGNAVRDLLNTLNHNLDEQSGAPRYQRSVSYKYIPIECVDEIQRRCEEDLQQLLSQVNTWLKDYNRPDTSQDKSTSELVRVGIGMYYFENDPKVEKE